MYGDTALLCILAGAGLLAAIRQNYTVARIAGMIQAVAANLYLTAGLGGFSVSVHALFPNLTAQILRPTRLAHIQMPRGTAVVFFLFGCALALISRRMSNQVLAIKTAIGVVIAGIGLVVTCGYLSGGGYAPFSDAVAGMAFMTAICAIALGVSLCALSVVHWRMVSEELSPSSVVIVAIGLILIFGATDTAMIVKTRAALLSGSGSEAIYSDIRAVHKALDAIRAVENRNRGFLLTRDDKSLASYMLATASLRADLGREELRRIQQWQDSKLQSLIAERVAQLDATIKLVQLHQHENAIELITGPTGSDLSAEIEREARFVMGELETEAVSRNAGQQILVRNLINLIVASNIIAALLIAVTVLLARLEARQHRRTSMRVSGTDILESVEPEHQETAPESPQNQKRVLLIEDSRDVMWLVEHALKKHGGDQYRLTWAKCLKDGFCELTRGGIDVVLLDLGLPESSGSISYACVRGCAPQVPIVVLTGEDCQETIDSIVAAGVDNYLVKHQVSGYLLVQAIETVLRMKKRPAQVNFRRLLSAD
jgi:CheY-like chemotaxis protein/CHASE3 domain sensor protein